MPDASAPITIRAATGADFPALWAMLRAVFRAGDTYAVDPQITEAATRALWMEMPRATFVAEAGGEVLGTYYIKTNQPGGGDHICNCGYITAPQARGRGLAERMCLHSQDIARQFGYQAMQFNFVLASNTGAVRLWTRLGFDTVGRIPRAFRHPQEGLTDALVMWKWLADRP